MPRQRRLCAKRYGAAGSAGYSGATYATDLEALRSHLRQNWQDAQIENLVAMQIENRLSHLAREKEIIVEEKIWLSHYQPIV